MNDTSARQLVRIRIFLVDTETVTISWDAAGSGTSAPRYLTAQGEPAVFGWQHVCAVVPRVGESVTIGHPDASTPGWPQHGRVVGVHHHIAAADRHSFDGGTDRVDVFITATPAVRQLDIRPAEVADVAVMAEGR